MKVKVTSDSGFSLYPETDADYALVEAWSSPNVEIHQSSSCYLVGYPRGYTESVSFQFYDVVPDKKPHPVHVALLFVFVSLGAILSGVGLGFVVDAVLKLL